MTTGKDKSSKIGPGSLSGSTSADDAVEALVGLSSVNYAYAIPTRALVRSAVINSVYRERADINPPGRIREVRANFVYQEKASVKLSATLVNFVYSEPQTRIRSAFRNTVYSTETTSRTVSTVAQFLNQAAYDTSYQFAFSNSSVSQFNSVAVIQRHEPLPISNESVNSFTHLVVVGADYDTTSMKFVGQYVSLANHASPQTRPADVWSYTRVGSETMLVCQSLDIAYVPRSGIDVPQFYNLTVSALPVAWQTRPAFSASVRQLTAQARPTERLPLSNTTVRVTTTLCSYPSVPDPRVGIINVPQTVSLASVPVAPDQTVGVILSPQVVSTAAVSTPEDLPISPESVNQVIGLAAVQGDDRMPLSNEDVPVVTSACAVESTVPWHWSPIDVRSEVLTAAQDSPLPPPESYFVLNAVGSLHMVYSMESDFGPAHKDSFTEMGALPILTAMKPPARFYPPLDNVIELDKGNHVSGYYTATAATVSDTFPLSDQDVGLVRIASASNTPMRPPAEVATMGVFTGGIVGHVAKESFFPTTDIPQSKVAVDNLAQNIVVVATYQDIRLPLTIGHVDQVAFNIVSIVDYPPANAAAGHDVLSSVAQNVARKTNYLPANTLNSLSLTTLTSANVALSTKYPDKDAIFSRIESRQVAASLAMLAEYPDKDTAYSSVETVSVLQNVMRVDSSLYQLPRPAQRHRPRIVCKMIYGYKNR